VHVRKSAKRPNARPKKTRPFIMPVVSVSKVVDCDGEKPVFHLKTFFSQNLSDTKMAFDAF